MNEQVMLGIELRRRHWRFEVKAQPLLNAEPSQVGAALREVEEQYEIEHNGRRQDGIAAEEVNLDLHRIAEPAEDIDVVPTFFVVAARRIVINPDFVEDLAVELGIHL